MEKAIDLNESARKLAEIVVQYMDEDTKRHILKTENPEVVGARESLLNFMVYEGRGEWQPEPHLVLLCDKLQKAFEGEIKRLMVFMPPRHGKSQVCSKKGPAWYLGKHPDKSIIMSSYSADLALDFSYIARETLEECRDVFPKSQIDPKSRAKARWSLEGYPEGGMFAAGVGGPITGRGAHVAIIDDPIKNHEEAASETVRESVWQWYKSTLRTRLAPGGSIVLIMTRWHEDDLAGRLIDKMKTGEGEQWEIIEFPGIAEEDDVLGRKKGEALSPRFPIEELDATKRALGKYIFGALYQQNPRAKEGNYFNVGWFGNAGITAEQARTVYSPLAYSAMDLSIGAKETNDWCAIATGVMTQTGELIPIDVNRFRVDSEDTASSDIAKQVVETQKKYNPLLFGFENGQIFKAVWPTIRTLKDGGLKKIPINKVELNPINDKIARARTLQSMMRNGMVLFPIGTDWYDDMESEMLVFPNGKWDDQVDALAWLAILVSTSKNAQFNKLMKMFS